MFNQNLFANILSKINSTYDSMTEFGKKADLDRSYISKYINKKLDNPPSPDILKKISEASNGIASYYELMEICGYIDLSSVFLLNDGFETNLCYWNKEDLKDIGFSQEDIEKLILLSNNNNIKNRRKKISDILNKYPETFLNAFYNKAMHQTNLKKEQNHNNISLCEIKKRLTDLIEKNELFLAKLANRDNTLKKIGAIPVSKTNVVEVPLLGTVKAGYDYMAQENWEGMVEVDKNIIKDGSDYFALKIKGNSMSPVLIEDDIVIIKKQSDFENGDLVVAIVNGDEATIKKGRKNDTSIILQPFNTVDYEPLIFTYDEMKTIPVTIVGIVKQLKREF